MTEQCRKAPLCAEGISAAAAGLRAGNEPPKASDCIDALPLGTAAQERSRAKGWCDEAARYASDANYWHTRASCAEAELARLRKEITAVAVRALVRSGEPSALPAALQLCAGGKP